MDSLPSAASLLARVRMQLVDQVHASITRDGTDALALELLATIKAIGKAETQLAAAIRVMTHEPTIVGPSAKTPAKRSPRPSRKRNSPPVYDDTDAGDSSPARDAS